MNINPKPNQLYSQVQQKYSQSEYVHAFLHGTKHVLSDSVYNENSI